MKFYGNKNSVFANALISEYVTSNDFNIEVSTGEWLSKEIEKAMPDKDDFFEEIKKASKKTRNGRSFTKLERTQMKKDAAQREIALMFEFNTALKKVHDKSLSNRKPKAYEPTLREALAEFYAEF